MEVTGPKLKIWTEGLDSQWMSSPEGPGRLDRGKMSPAEIEKAIQQIRFINGDIVDGKVIAQYQGRQLEFSFNNAEIQASDPQDLNYQNVSVKEAELVSFLESHFKLEELEDDVTPNPVRIIEWMVLTAFITGLVFSIIYVQRYFSQNSSFLPIPETVEFDDREVASSYLSRYAGIYLTGIEDGEMAIELQPNGQFAYYDLERTGTARYRMEAVRTGTYRPVLISGQFALVTDSRFIFTPETENSLDFLQRRFVRQARSRDDTPFLRFPD